jgi:hypothetical protein
MRSCLRETAMTMAGKSGRRDRESSHLARGEGIQQSAMRSKVRSGQSDARNERTDHTSRDTTFTLVCVSPRKKPEERSPIVTQTSSGSQAEKQDGDRDECRKGPSGREVQVKKFHSPLTADWEKKGGTNDRVATSGGDSVVYALTQKGKKASRTRRCSRGPSGVAGVDPCSLARTLMETLAGRGAGWLQHPAGASIFFFFAFSLCVPKSFEKRSQLSGREDGDGKMLCIVSRHKACFV